MKYEGSAMNRVLLIFLMIFGFGCGLKQGIEHNEHLRKDCLLIAVSDYSSANGAHIHQIYKCPGDVKRVSNE